MTAADRLPEWVLWIQALGPTAGSAVTAIIALAVAVVAWRQWVTAREKVALDLLDRRYQLFLDISAAIDERALAEVAGWDNRVFDLVTRTGMLFGKDATRAVNGTLVALHAGRPVEQSEEHIHTWAQIFTSEMAMPTRYRLKPRRRWQFWRKG